MLCMSAGNAFECEFTQNETDPFSKDSFVKTKWQLLSQWNDSKLNQRKEVEFSIDVHAETEGTQNFLVLKMKMKDGSMYKPGPEDMRNAVTVRQGDLLRITLLDESIVELPAENTAWAPARMKPKDNAYIYRATLDVRYLIDAESGRALIRQNAKFLHLDAMQNGHEFIDDRAPLDFDIKGKNRREIKRAVRCLKQAN